jgi:integrase
VRGDTAQVHPAGAVLNEHQHIQALQQHRVSVQEGRTPGSPRPGQKGTGATSGPTARREALGDADARIPLMGRPYDLRHAAVSTWLNAGVPAAQVAEWAGHSVDVLLRVYVKCIAGQQGEAKRRIEDAMRPLERGEPGSIGEPPGPEHPDEEHSGP